MSRASRISFLSLLLLLVVSSGATAQAANLDAYRVKATAANLEKLARAGFDVTEGRRKGSVEIVATAATGRRAPADAEADRQEGHPSRVRPAGPRRARSRAHRADQRPGVHG